MATATIARSAAVLMLAALATVCPAQATTQPALPGAAASSKPITTDRGPLGDLLRKWAAEGTAAGNVGDYYDNRDRGHSVLDIAPYPQLQRIAYSDAERKLDRDWAVQATIRPEVVFGNSSTASPAAISGSNTRLLYASRGGLDLLHAQYRQHNLYLYPSHQDYLPGRHGLDGGFYGDLLPTNTPYVITSQGSSYTDQPFLREIAFALAALRPEVKAKLVSDGLLMPTLQMLFRMSNKQVATPEDYLTGKAHPPVFDGNQVDPLKMVTLAHQIDLAHLPPLAQLALLGADDPKPGRDFFDPFPSESLGTTPSVVARVFRGYSGVRHLTVSAAGSTDPNGLPLSYHWVVLRGDASKITITPQDKSGALVDIIIPYHERAPIAPGSPLESNRVDIGLIVHNGHWYSAPAFITSYTLDSEARTYDADGRVLEIGYDMFDSVFTIDNPPALVAWLKSASPLASVVTAGMSPAELAAIAKLSDHYAATGAKIPQMEKQYKEEEELVKTASPAAKPHLEEKQKQRRQALDAAIKARDELFLTAQAGASQPLKTLLMQRLQAMVDNPLFYPHHAAACGVLAAPAEAERKRLLDYGIVSAAPGATTATTQGTGQVFALNPVLPGNTPAEQRLSRYQQAMLSRFNAQVLCGAIPGLKYEYRWNYVDFRLSIPKHWRDVYHYDAAGRLTGWTRYDGTAAREFTPAGEIALSRDALGRPLITQTVSYLRSTPMNGNPKAGPDMTPMTYVPGKKIMRYSYASDTDFTGHVEVTEDAPATAPAH